MQIISSIFLGYLIASILIGIVQININNFLKAKGVDAEEHSLCLFSDIKTDGKDKKEFDYCMFKIQLIFTLIFSVASYFILPLFP